MKVKRIIAGFVLLLTGWVILLIIYNLPGFSGKQIKASNAYTLDLRQMNGNDSHTLKLTAGDVLEVTFEAEKGNLHMKITAPDGASVYDGNGKDPTAFEINIRETGLYAVAVEARHAKGKIFIRLKEVTK